LVMRSVLHSSRAKAGSNSSAGTAPSFCHCND
jgi:hypothetical protein